MFKLAIETPKTARDVLLSQDAKTELSNEELNGVTGGAKGVAAGSMADFTNNRMTAAEKAAAQADAYIRA